MLDQDRSADDHRASTHMDIAALLRLADWLQAQDL